MRGMEVFGICAVRDEADVIGVTVRHHLSLGLDRVIVLDNGSTDGTGEVLRGLAKADPRVWWWRDDSPFDQSALYTRLARQAYRQGADWVVPFDADEFWWVADADGDFRGVLAGAEPSAGGLRAPTVEFVQARDRLRSTPDALLTMTRRPAETFSRDENARLLVESGEISRLQRRSGGKIISRATEDLEIGRGNHKVFGLAGELADASDALACLHAPLRSRAHLESKLERSRRLAEAGIAGGAWHVWRWARLIEEGKLDEEWAACSYEGEHLDVYGTKHAVVFDGRLRDVVARCLEEPLRRDTGASRPKAPRIPGLARVLGGVADSARAGVARFAPGVRSVMPAADLGGEELERTKRELAETKKRLERAEHKHKRLRQRVRDTRQLLKRANRDLVLSRMPEGSVCAEIGVHEGDFSARILDAVRPERLHLIDPWKQGEGLFGKQAAEQAALDERHERVVARFADEISAGRVVLHRALSADVAPEFPDAYFDWVYVDGNHLREAVEQDLQLYWPKVKDGGYIAGDDYGVRGYWENGVQEAVDGFVSRTPEASLEVEGTQFVIRKASEPS